MFGLSSGIASLVHWSGRRGFSRRSQANGRFWVSPGLARVNPMPRGAPTAVFGASSSCGEPGRAPVPPPPGRRAPASECRRCCTQRRRPSSTAVVLQLAPRRQVGSERIGGRPSWYSSQGGGRCRTGVARRQGGRRRKIASGRDAAGPARLPRHAANLRGPAGRYAGRLAGRRASAAASSRRYSAGAQLPTAAAAGAPGGCGANEAVLRAKPPLSLPSPQPPGVRPTEEGALPAVRRHAGPRLLSEPRRPGRTPL
jgi:hypothetical protein